jgi:hypothetical protein
MYIYAYMYVLIISVYQYQEYSCSEVSISVYVHVPCSDIDSACVTNSLFLLFFWVTYVHLYAYMYVLLSRVFFLWSFHIFALHWYVHVRSRSRNFILGTNKSTKKDRRVARTLNWSQTGNSRYRQCLQRCNEFSYFSGRSIHVCPNSYPEYSSSEVSISSPCTDINSARVTNSVTCVHVHAYIYEWMSADLRVFFLWGFHISALYWYRQRPCHKLSYMCTCACDIDSARVTNSVTFTFLVAAYMYVLIPIPSILPLKFPYRPLALVVLVPV